MILDQEKVIRILKDEPQFDRDRHGSLWDRGSADSYYHRGARPHWWPEGTGNGKEVTELNMEEIEEYLAGYEDNEKYGEKKNWGHD